MLPLGKAKRCNKKHQRGYLFLLMILTFSTFNYEVEAKEFKRCELTRELLQKYQINKTFLSNWICLVEHESYLDTRKISRKLNGSLNYGLFQINNREWCRSGRRGGYCNKKCEDFIDDNIDDDVQCAKLIVEREGFKHWKGWNQFCRDTQNLPNLALACNVHTIPISRIQGASRLFV